MNTSSRPSSKSGSFLSRLLYTGLSIWMLGAVYTPALAAVTVDQSPLIIQRSLPPNVVLMLDDSGSMAWDYMPDWGYLSDKSDDGVRNASINGTYYSPSAIYSLPPKADGTFYTAPTSITSAYQDGFAATGATNITTFTGGHNGDGANTFPYYTAFVVSVLSTVAAAPNYNYTCPVGYSTYQTTKCRKNVSPYTVQNATATIGSYSCSGADVMDGTGQNCTRTTLVTKNFFTYTTGASNTQNYVGVAGDCAYLNAAQQLVCDDSAATRKNVAIWFSFYRTRILMAKSGLMNSFSTLDPTFRVGFGSIDGGDSGNNNYLNLPTSQYSYSDTYSGGTNYIAQVQPFGDGTDSTSQKSQFWKWVSKVKASGGTPLRQALDAVGQYYSDSGMQPWNGMSSDPDFGTAAAAASTQLACRQSYTILTTDGFWNDSFTGAGDTDGTAGTTITGSNAQTYSYAVASPFSDSGVTTTTTPSPAKCAKNFGLNPISGTYWCTRKNYSNQTPTCSSGTLSTDQSQCTVTTTGPGTTYSNTLADVAMKYWRTDLQTSMSNEVPTNGDDPAFWQHMSTFTLGLGFTPQYADGTQIPVDQVLGWARGDNSKAIANFNWPKPASNSIYNIADLAHAAVNGHGGFYSATSPEAFASGLKEALKRASERVGTGASLAANSTQLQTGTVAYQANYWTAKWKGDLKALEVDSTSGAITTTDWTASTKLPTAASRNIKTYNPTASPGSQFVDFMVASDGTLPLLSTAQHAALSNVAGTATNETDLINYLRGDSAKAVVNKGSYRNRDIVIGDIVNSQPVYAGAPNANQFYTEAFTGSSAFSQYASDNAGRAGSVYVASNDGMLHGFDSTTGAEKFAYLPGAVITAGVSALASVEYGGTVAHGFFNDGELTVGDAYIGSTPAWTTVLVGTTGRGVARTVYALDITDPANVKFLWERSALDGNADGNSKYIGEMTGKPVIAQTANGTWSVLIGNGYNSTAGVSSLLQFDLGTGTLHVHKTTDSSGLAAAAVWMDPSGNGVSTTAYAGDANGNVWSFALNTSGTATPDSDGVKLFTAVDSGGTAQPITAGMLAGKDPATGNTWVFFGTGKYLTSTDLTNLNTQSWYGLIVESGTAGLAVTSTSTRATDLVNRSITSEVGNGRTVTTLAQAAAASTSITGKSGWYVDLVSPTGTAGAAVQQGERMVTPNQFQGNLLLGTTRIPQATDPCNPSGRGWVMALDPFTGTNPSSNFFDRNGDGNIDSSDSVGGTPAAGIGFSSLPNNPIFVGSTMLTSFDNGTTSSIKTSSSTGSLQRVSWRELIAQ